MASVGEDHKMLSLRMLTLELQQFHWYGGWTFEHRRQPFSPWFVFVLVIIFIDTINETVFTFVLDYDEQLFFATGYISSFFFGPRYRYFPILFFYKVVGVCSLIVHITSKFDWIELIDRQLQGLGDQVSITRMEMENVIRQAKQMTFGAVYLWIGLAFIAVFFQTLLVHSGRPWYFVLPTFLSIEFTGIVYTYLHWCLLGQYYLIISYCIRLVRAGNRNLIEAIKRARNNRSHLDQAFGDIEVIASCVHLIWKYVLKIYLIYLISTSCMIPIYIFNATYAGVSVFVKFVLVSGASYFVSLVCFLSYLPGRIDTQLESSSEQLYRSILSKDKARSIFSLRYKYLKFELHSLYGLGLSIGDFRVNLSTCISLATIYVTVFSLFLHSRNSVGRIEFAE